MPTVEVQGKTPYDHEHAEYVEDCLDCQDRLIFLQGREAGRVDAFLLVDTWARRFQAQKRVGAGLLCRLSTVLELWWVPDNV